MDMATERGFALASSPEEVALRRKLLFRLLRDFDFSRPRVKGEFISDPVPPERTPSAPAPGH